MYTTERYIDESEIQLSDLLHMSVRFDHLREIIIRTFCHNIFRMQLS